MPNKGATALRQTQTRISRGLWQWCSSRGALLALLLLLALALALSGAFPQTPARIRADPTMHNEWLSTVQVRYRDWTPALEALGAFSIRDALWFRVLLALLAFVLLISLAERIRSLVDMGPVGKPDGFYDGPDAVALPSAGSVEGTLDRTRVALQRLGLRMREERVGETEHIHAYRRRWATAHPVVTQVGALLIVLALAVDGRWGWTQPDVYLLPDRPVLLGPEQSHSVELLDARAPLSEAMIQADGRQVPLRTGGIARHQGYEYTLDDKTGWLMRVTAQRSSGEDLLLSEYAVRPDAGQVLEFAVPAAAPEQTDALFIVPDEKLVVRLESLPRSDRVASPRFRQWVFEQDGQSLIGEAEVETSDGAFSVTVGDVVYTWEMSPYIVIDVARQPGRWAFVAGIALVVLGLLGQLVPRQQVWSAVSPKGDASTVRIQEETQGPARWWRKRRDQAWDTLRLALGDLE